MLDFRSVLIIVVNPSNIVVKNMNGFIFSMNGTLHYEIRAPFLWKDHKNRYQY